MKPKLILYNKNPTKPRLEATTLENLPTAQQIEAGNLVASEMYDASIQSSMKGLGGCKEFDIEQFHYKDIVQAYLNKEIDTVTGIYLAMQRSIA